MSKNKPKIGDDVLVFVNYPLTKVDPNFQGKIIAVTESQYLIHREGIFGRRSWHSLEEIEVIRTK